MGEEIKLNSVFVRIFNYCLQKIMLLMKKPNKNIFLLILLITFLNCNMVFSQLVSVTLPDKISGECGKEVKIPLSIFAGAVTVTNFNVRILFDPAVITLDTVDCGNTLAKGVISRKGGSDIQLGYVALPGINSNGVFVYVKGRLKDTGFTEIKIDEKRSTYNQNLSFSAVGSCKITAAEYVLKLPQITLSKNDGELIQIPIMLNKPLAKNIKTVSLQFNYDVTKLTINKTDVKTTGKNKVDCLLAKNNNVGTCTLNITVSKEFTDTILAVLMVKKKPEITEPVELKFESCSFNNGEVPASAEDGFITVAKTEN